MTRLEAFQLVMMLGAAFPQRELGEPTIELYVTFLLDVDRDAGAAAVQRLIATAKWLPTIGEIRGAVFATGSPPQAEEAWEEVCQQIARSGSYNRPQFSHPLIARTVTMIGWRVICHSSMPGLERKHFFDIYRELRRRAAEDAQAPPPLALSHPSASALSGPGARPASGGAGGPTFAGVARPGTASRAYSATPRSSPKDPA